jgi:hypothetical protein
MEPLAYVRGFDYNFQTWIDMPDKQRILKKGDELSMTCVFDSRGRTNTTRWGYATSDEMCFWWWVAPERGWAGRGGGRGVPGRWG